MRIHDTKIEIYEDRKTGERYEIKLWDDGQCGPIYDISKIPQRHQIESLVHAIADFQLHAGYPSVIYSGSSEHDAEKIGILSAGINEIIYSPSDRVRFFVEYFYPMITKMCELNIITRSKLLGVQDFYEEFVLDISDRSEIDQMKFAEQARFSFIKNSNVAGDIMIFFVVDCFCVARNPFPNVKFHAKLCGENFMDGDKEED